MLPLVILLITIPLAIYFYQTRNHDYWKKLGVPCAKHNHWFFGHYKHILMMTRHMGEVFKDIYDAFPDASVVGFYKISTPGLLLRDPDIIKAVLTTDFNVFAKNDIKIDKDVDPMAANNPFALDGEEWKVSRGHATPLSTYAKLRTYLPNIIEVGDVMIKYMKEKCDEQGDVELETKNLSGMYTTDVVANALLGVSNNAFADNDSLFSSITREIFSGTFLDGFKIMISFIFPKLGPLLRLRFSSKRTEDLLMSLVANVMRRRTETGENRNDIFQQMITLRKTDTLGLITDQYVASHCFSFIADGYETSSDAICFTLFELAWASEVQEKLRREIKAMITQTNGQYSVEDIDNLKYLNMVVSESLRIHPPGLVLSKLPIDDYVLPLDKHTGKSIVLKKDIAVVIPLYALHTDPKYFPDPEKFDPDRFTDENIANRHKYVYLPFGEGPRKCLGQRIALLQVKIAIVKLLENFRLNPSNKSAYPVQIDPQCIVKRPLNGAWVRFELLRN